MEGFITALASQWHPECFCCKVSGRKGGVGIVELLDGGVGGGISIQRL